MIDQLFIGDKGSYDDFSASLAKRVINLPKKKSIKETVPFSNKTYDFSAINGEVYWEERELEYIFEMIANTAEELEEMKAAFADWVANVMEAEIYDPFIPDYHFVGTYADMDFEDDEGLEKTTATVKFTAYPYKVANLPKKYSCRVEGGESLLMAVQNNSSHRIMPTITASGSIVVVKGLTEYELVEGENYIDESFFFEAGDIQLTIRNDLLVARTLEFSFIEEVL